MSKSSKPDHSHGAASDAAFGWMADHPGESAVEVLPRFVTGSLKVDFLKPTPLQHELTTRAVLDRIEGRKVWAQLTLAHGDTDCATGEMLAIGLR